MPPRTALYLTPSSRLEGGARHSLLQLVTHLDPARYRPVVVSQRPGALLEALDQAGVENHVQFLGWWRKGRYWPMRPLRILQLANLTRRSDAALLHCNEFYPNPYAVRAARRAGHLPVVTHMRLSITPRQIHNYDLRRANRVVCVSEAAAGDFAAVWPDWRECVEVIYNGVDLERYRVDAPRTRLRHELDLQPDDFVVTQVGLLTPRKRPHLLVEAAARSGETIDGILREQGRAGGRLVVLLVGGAGRSDGPYGDSLRERVAQDAALSRRVRFVPFSDRIERVYAASDLITLLSSDEGFGRTIVEAGALETPSIATRVGGMPELIIDGETGCLVPAEDDGGAALAATLTALARTPEALRLMGQAARQRVLEHFTIGRHAERMMDLYDRVLQKNL